MKHRKERDSRTQRKRYQYVGLIALFYSADCRCAGPRMDDLRCRSIARTLVQRLKAKHRCLYLNSPTMVSGMRYYLAAAGFDPLAEVERRALILSSDQGHLGDWKFDVPRMIRLLRDSVKLALDDAT
jgi:hypothetical protein